MSDEKQEILIPADGSIVDATAAPRQVAPSPAQILAKGIDEGKLDADGIRAMTELVATQREWDSVTAFNEALAQFHANCPELINETQGKIKTKDGVKVVLSWMYTKLNKLAAKVRPFLKPLGLSFSFDEAIGDGIVTASCTLRHVLGHSVTAHASCPTGSTNRMSPAHAHTAAGNNAKRRALIDVLGVTPVDEPDENSTEDVGPISEKQAADLDAMISESGASLGKFLLVFDIEKVADLPARKFGPAIQTLKDRMKR